MCSGTPSNHAAGNSACDTATSRPDALLATSRMKVAAAKDALLAMHSAGVSVGRNWRVRKMQLTVCCLTPSCAGTVNGLAHPAGPRAASSGCHCTQARPRASHRRHGLLRRLLAFSPPRRPLAAVALRPRLLAEATVEAARLHHAVFACGSHAPSRHSIARCLQRRRRRGEGSLRCVYAELQNMIVPGAPTSESCAVVLRGRESTQPSAAPCLYHTHTLALNNHGLI